MNEAFVERQPRSELRQHVACVWFERHTGGHQPRSHAVADGFVDLVYGRSLWVRGPDTRAHPIRYEEGSCFVGVRLRPGAAPVLLGIGANELVDRRIFLTELWGRDADDLSGLVAEESEEEVADALQAALLTRLGRADPVVEWMVAELEREPRLSVRRLVELSGLSERQLLRRSRVGLGYGPKTLQRIFRLRRFQRLAAHGGSLARMALTAGYADQAHLTRECRRLTGRTPAAFVS